MFSAFPRISSCYICYLEIIIIRFEICILLEILRNCNFKAELKYIENMLPGRWHFQQLPLSSVVDCSSVRADSSLRCRHSRASLPSVFGMWHCGRRPKLALVWLERRETKNLICVETKKTRNISCFLKFHFLKCRQEEITLLEKTKVMIVDLSTPCCFYEVYCVRCVCSANKVGKPIQLFHMHLWCQCRQLSMATVYVQLQNGKCLEAPLLASSHSQQHTHAWSFLSYLYLQPQF